MIFANEAGYYLAAIAENNQLTDFWIQQERRIDRGAAGNIYRGEVAKVIPALSAAFVDIGLEKHGFLSFSDLGASNRTQLRKKGRKGSDRIEDLLRVGDRLLVQIGKEAIADKGPSLTGKISMPGRCLIYMPYSKAIRMSRMLDESEKKRFRALVEQEMEFKGGLIFRTASKGLSGDQILNDLRYILETWRNILDEFESGYMPKLIHQEIELFERVMRDNFSDHFFEILIDHPRLKHRIVQFLKIIAPDHDYDQLIRFHTDKTHSVWSATDLVRDIDRLFSKNVALDCGGRIIIEEMETLTAIDVNSGKNIKGKTQEETILETNLEAAVEIPRQLRLRQIGGIIIIDFIDMRLKRDRDKVFKLLEEEFAKDRTPSDIQEFTNLELVQVTRQRMGESLAKRLTYTCPRCSGSGRLPSISLD